MTENVKSEKVNLKQLKIILNTNVDEKQEPLTYSKIYIPQSENIQNNRKVKIMEYPFFTDSVAYPEEYLKTIKYKDIITIFFSKNAFIKNVVEKGDKSSPNPKMIEKNIMIMLDLLFPTSFPSDHNINTTYNKYLKKTPYTMNFDMKNITSGLLQTPSSKFSYLKLNGITYTVSEIVLLNDVINHPVYKKLIEDVSEYIEWAEETSEDVKKEINDVKEKFAERMNPTNANSLFFSKEDEYIIKKQKKLFTLDDFENEVRKIFKYFTYSDEPIIKKFIQSLNTIDRRITNLDRNVSRNYFNETLEKNLADQTFKNINDIKNDNIESIMKKIYTSISNDESKTKGENPIITYFLNFIYESFNKYIKSKESIARSRDIAEIQKNDSNVDKILSKIEDWNNMNIEKIDIKKIDSITDNVETINELFEKIKSGASSSEIRPITTKITELFKLSKELKALTLVQKYILSNNQGILIDENDIKNEYDKKLFSEEIKKQQYKTYTDLVNTYKTTISDKQYKSMNIKLQKLIDDYFKYQNSKFKTELVDAVNSMNRIKPKFDYDLWNTSISSYILKERDFITEPYSIYKRMEIYVHMELISGELNDSKLNVVNCEYSNNRLINMLDELTSKDKNYNLNKNKNVFKLPEQPNMQANPAPDPSQAPAPAPPGKSGGKGTRRRIRKNKKTRKL
jgi:hypothetical protein